MHDRQFTEFDDFSLSDAELERLRAVNRTVTGFGGRPAQVGPRYVVPGTGNDSTFECDRVVSGSCAGVCSDCSDCGPRYVVPKDPSIRTFETGATRDADEGKYDYEGFFSPLVLRERAAYMDRHRVQSDGSLRASDNWQQGIPLDQYAKSAFRHFVEWWTLHRDYDNSADIREAICALMFNAEGYLFELIRDEEEQS